MIDEHDIVHTPEGADLALPLAGPLPRAGAWLLDLFFRGLLYLGLTIALFLLGLGGLGALAPALFFIAAFLLEWWYPVLFEALRQGQTPGKRALGIAVVHTDGTPASFNASVLRNLLRVADFFPFAYLTGLIATLASPRFQRLGDLAADTLVVHVQSWSGPAEVPWAEDNVRAMPDWPLTLADQQSLIALAERAPRLSEARRLELAQQAFPEYPGEAAERHALALARGLLGDP